VDLSSCDKLVLDLRGHVGGGLGVLRLMSHLTPDKLPIGYTVTRKRAETGYDKNTLRRLDRLPTDLPNPLAIASMAVQFVGRDSSVVLVSEGLYYRVFIFEATLKVAVLPGLLGLDVARSIDRDVPLCGLSLSAPMNCVRCSCAAGSLPSTN
jgi:hypothetical protein